jgi:UTP:GlnB (protein PII) uridylyltransferase
MSNYLERAKTALGAFAQAWRGQGPAPPAPSPGADAGPPRADDGISFADAGCSARDPRSWLALFEVAVAQNVPVSPDALEAIRQAAPHVSPEALLPDDGSRQRFLRWLRPRSGLSGRLMEMHAAGVLAVLFPELGPIAHAARAIGVLERLPYQATVAGERFGGLLRELPAPETLVLTLLFHDAPAALDRIALPRETRQAIAFLVNHEEEMSRVAFRSDADDPDVVRAFASLFGTEEQLKMLALITLANLGASSPETLTPWKEELLWRLYVDTYNEITMAYGDQVIADDDQALAAVREGRPAGISEGELTGFLAGLPRRYLTLFDPATIYEHVRLWRDIRHDDVHFFLKPRGDGWELTVVTLDKPFLFSNICGVLAGFGMNILRGYAFTSSSALALDVFQFTDREAFFARQDAQAQFNARLEDVVAGRAGIAQPVPGAEAYRAGPRTPPVIYFDNEHSRQYTILELVTDDAPGLLHRVSQVVSRHGLSVELVLISTEGDKAVDVFHLKKGTEKLTESDQIALAEDLERVLEESAASGGR